MIRSEAWDNWELFSLAAASLLALLVFWRPLKRFGSQALVMANSVWSPLKEGARPGWLVVPDTGLRGDPKRPFRKEPKFEDGLEASQSADARRRNLLEQALLVTTIIGDYTMIVLGFVLAALLCQWSTATFGISKTPMPEMNLSWRLIMAASLIVLWGLTGRGLYHYRSLSQPSKSWVKLLEGFGLCLFALTCFTLIVRTDPPVPWFFYACSTLIIFLNVYNWRLILGLILRWPLLRTQLRRRLVVIGTGAQTRKIQKSLEHSPDLEFVGWVQANKPNQVAELEKFRLGPVHELETILQRHSADIAVLTESESLQREGVLAVARVCESAYVQFKMVPHFFEILVSGLRPETIGETQLLGVESLPLSGYRSRIAKRTVDIIGALVGLALAVPLVIICGILVYRESPGPILYKQLRLGQYGRCFSILKIRSMRMDAEAEGKPQWAQQNDQRRLRIGAFMRRWNIDEVPQFWNVLTGSMSLVGPRPERPELIARFKTKIPHYQARHMYRPGMTGWAQVNGWRVNTDLEERIRHDIWYLENWSLWLDFRIMLRTFYCRKNAC
jgi:exopolysaccharide biosynthesis polyprenyl glycosylphosphotransferase